MKPTGLICLLLLEGSCFGTLWAQDAASSIAAGNQAYQAKNYPQAEKYYEAAAELNPQSAQAYEGWGDCEYRMGHKSEALSEFERSVALNPSNSRLKSFIQNLRTQVSGGNPSSAGALASEKEIQETEDEERSLEKDLDESEPFKPYWENELQFSSANQQEGQSTNTLSYMGTDHLDKAGNTLGGQVQAIRQKVEGAGSNIGALAMNGGLGLGSFSPSLSLGGQSGNSAWHQLNGTLTLDLQLWDPLSLSYVLGGNVGSHGGTFSQVDAGSASQLNLPVTVIDYLLAHPVPVRIDTGSWNTSFGPVFAPWEWWSISPTIGYEYDITYEFTISGPKKTYTAPINGVDEIGTLTLTMDFTLFKGFILEIAPQVGQEYYPAGTVYSPLAGGAVYHPTATTVNYTGGTTSISYSFE